MLENVADVFMIAMLLHAAPTLAHSFRNCSPPIASLERLVLSPC